jgi:hypothetical protein
MLDVHHVHHDVNVGTDEEDGTADIGSPAGTGLAVNTGLTLIPLMLA